MKRRVQTFPAEPQGRHYTTQVACLRKLFNTKWVPLGPEAPSFGEGVFRKRREM